MHKALWFRVVVDNVEQKPITCSSLQAALRTARRRFPEAQSLEVTSHKWNEEQEPNHDPS